MKVFIKWNKVTGVFILAWFLIGLNPIMAQQTFPLRQGDCIYYNFTMTTAKTELSGLCILKLNNEVVNASIVNDFGATFIDYSYKVEKSKVRIHYVFNKLDKWYIRRILKRNLKKIMIAMRKGETTYRDSKHKLTYTFTLNHDIKR